MTIYDVEYIGLPELVVIVEEFAILITQNVVKYPRNNLLSAFIVRIILA